MEYSLKSDLVKDFITGGNATVTIKSTVTQKHFTYKLKCARKYKNDPNKFLFVSLLNGPNNNDNFVYIGMIKNKAFQLTKKSAFSLDAPSVKAFHWFSSHIFNDSLPETCEVYHSGRCGRCGKKLTVPESIESGFGPECINKI